MGRRNRAGRGGGVKLTELDATEIYRAGGLQREIAERYGVHQTTVSLIKRRRLWGFLHRVPGPPSPLSFIATRIRIVSRWLRSLIGL